MNKWMNLIILTFACFMASACGKTTAEDAQKEKEAAAQVIRQFESTQSTITYKDPTTFTAGDPYLTPEFAKQYHEMRAGMDQFIKESQIIVSGTEPKVTYVKHDGDDLIFNFEADRTLTSELTKTSAASHVQYIVTVTKQNDGAFLISHMEEPKEGEPKS